MTGARRCLRCRNPLQDDAAEICDKCSLPQRWFSHPYLTFVGAISTATIIPTSAFYIVRDYQQVDHQREVVKGQLDENAKDLQSAIGSITSWQPLIEGLRTNCEPGHVGDAQLCLADYTARLVKLDEYVAKLSWTVAATPVSENTYAVTTAWKNMWWTKTRSDVKQAFLKLADGKDSQLVKCQSDFETSECVQSIYGALGPFEAKTFELFCGFTNDLNDTKIHLVQTTMKQNDAQTQSFIHSYEMQENQSSCAKFRGARPK